MRGVLYGVPSITAFEESGYTWDRVTLLPDDVLQDADTAPPDGTVVQEQTGGTFVVYRGTRFTLANTDFGPRGDFSQSQISVVVPIGFLGEIPEGGLYRRRLSGRLGWAFVGLRRLERARWARVTASHTVAFVVGVLSFAVVWYFTR